MLGFKTKIVIKK